MSNSTASSHAWTPAMIRAFAEDRKTTACIKAIRRARSYAAETRAKVDAYCAVIFAKYEFFNDLDVKGGEAKARITDPDKLYLSEDEAGCKRYYAECFQAALANGYDVKDEQCPALVAENKVIALERSLLHLASKHFNFDFTTCHGKLRERALNLFGCL